MVARETSGNITRPPKRSVSAPTGIRPNEPTSTGTATSTDCWNELRCSVSLSRGARGLSRAQAQKFTAKPTVAVINMRDRGPLAGLNRLIILSLSSDVGFVGVSAFRIQLYGDTSVEA